MKASDLLILADSALTTLPLAALAAHDDSARWLAINSTATTLLGAMRGIAADPGLTPALRHKAERAAAGLRPIQRESCMAFERTQQLAA